MAASCEEAAYFKFQVKSGSSPDCCKIMKVSLADRLSDVIGDIVPDNVKVSRVQCGSFDTPVETPFAVIKEFGCNLITVWVQQDQEKNKDENNNNIFSILMSATRKYDFFPKRREENNAKDRLYNSLIAVFREKSFGFTSQQVDSLGPTMVSTITNCLWYLDPFLERLEARSITVPKLFKGLTGYRELKKQKKKIPQIMATELKAESEKLGELLLLPWLLRGSVAVLREAIESLHSGMGKYHSFLTDMKQRTSTNHNKTEPVRSFYDNWSMKAIEATSVLKPEYSALDQALVGMSNYEALDLCDFEPVDKEDRRKWIQGLSLSCTVTHFTYAYGNYLGNMNIVWKIPEKIGDRNPSEDARLVNISRENIMTFATRKMRKDFIEKYSKSCKIQPAILRNIHAFLTNYEYTPRDKIEENVDKHISFLLESQDTDLLFDLRRNNGKVADPKFDPFWEEIGKYLDEKSAVHERRHGDTQYMPFAISVEDLRNQIIERLPEGTPAPSTSWIRLNFHPRNPYSKSAANYTGRFNVKFAVQQRLLRVQHEDSSFGRHQFQLLKSFCVKWRDHCEVQSLDDKAIIPVGEPEHPVSTGVRSHHGGLVSADQKIVALDHDFHVAGLVPSVCFRINIPESDHDSFYNGTVHVTLKDKVLQPSSPLRHATETIDIVRHHYSEDDVNLHKPILCRYTDGGPDHRTTYKSVQMCCLIEFISLDLDMLCCVRTAPSQSYHNPAERVMSVLNLALQNVALERNSMSPAFEMQVKSLTSLKKLRKAADQNKLLHVAYSESIGGPQTLIKERFAKLKWKGDMFKVNEPATKEDMQQRAAVLHVLDPGANFDDPKTWESEVIKNFMEAHSRKRHYMFQLKKCHNESCGYCSLNPPRLPADLFSSLHFLPDPVPGADGLYKDFGEVYGTQTTDDARPGLLGKEPISERDKQFRDILVATKVRGYVICFECGKRRLVYCSKKLDTVQERALSRVQEELLYICGSPLFPGGINQDKIIVREGLSCSSPMETTYYAGKTMQFEDVCYHCSDYEVVEDDLVKQLREEYGIVRPICQTCLQEGKKIKTRNAVKTKKQRTK